MEKEIILKDRKWEFIKQDKKTSSGETLYTIKYYEYSNICGVWTYISQDTDYTEEVIRDYQEHIKEEYGKEVQ